MRTFIATLLVATFLALVGQQSANAAPMMNVPRADVSATAATPELAGYRHHYRNRHYRHYNYYGYRNPGFSFYVGPRFYGHGYRYGRGYGYGRGHRWH
jgi:hypothetical protein